MRNYCVNVSDFDGVWDILLFCVRRGIHIEKTENLYFDEKLEKPY